MIEQVCDDRGGAGVCRRRGHRGEFWRAFLAGGVSPIPVSGSDELAEVRGQMAVT